MKKHWITITILNCLLLSFTTGCKKDFLNAKPSTDIVQPISLDEFHKLLDNPSVINVTCALNILASDEYVYSSDEIWQSARTATERNSYKWAKDLYEGEEADQWNKPYAAIFYANNVLSGLQHIDITDANSTQWRNIKGWALFVRAFAYYELVSYFAPAYDAATSDKLPGVPLKLTPSIDELLPRSSLQQTYEQIIADLTAASQLLPINLPAGRTRPSKVAAHALFARIYLNRREYQKAEAHADTCLSLNDKLIDYNSLSKTSSTPFARNHEEQIYAKQGIGYASYTGIGRNNYTQISTDYINLYEPNDLRLQIYFAKQADGTYDAKSGYFGPGINPFVGLATDEVFLIKAECAARRGDVAKAMSTLNQLLIKRYAAGKFAELSAGSGPEALAKVLLERKKELIWRAIRWEDIKRLNKEGANITLTRTINGTAYILPPEDLRYVFPIPDNEINLSGIQQNIR